MSHTYVSAVDARASDAVMSVRMASAFSAPIGAILKADLLVGHLTPADYAREARAAGVDAAEIVANIKQAVAAKETATLGGDGIPEPECILPAGKYFGRKHETAVKIVDGIFVPADAGTDKTASTAPSAEDSVEASLLWLRQQKGTWGGRAAERLGPGNDFLPDLELHDESRGGRVPDGKIGAEAARHLAAALQVNTVVETLNLGYNELGPEGVAHLASALESNRVVTDLNLAGNQLGDAGVPPLVAALKVNSTLNALDVSDNGIGVAAAAELRLAWGARDPAALSV